MAYDAGQDDAALAAADRALAADPTSRQAMLYTAQVMMRRTAAATPRDAAAWSAARRWIVTASRQAPDDAEALSLYYDSFAAAGETPSAAAILGIGRALELVPQDPALRFKVAAQAIMDGQTDAARRALRPLAYDPHQPADNPAARLIAILDTGVTGPAAMLALARARGEAVAATPSGPTPAN